MTSKSANFPYPPIVDPYADGDLLADTENQLSTGIPHSGSMMSEVGSLAESRNSTATESKRKLPLDEDSIRVAIRVRPKNQTELSRNDTTTVTCAPDNQTIQVQQQHSTLFDQYGRLCHRIISLNRQ
jgi:hypothetical protein